MTTIKFDFYFFPNIDDGVYASGSDADSLDLGGGRKCDQLAIDLKRK
jgi:hypothetical protein